MSFLVIFVSNKTTEDMTPPQKERIIDQAMQMFATQGIKSVRMDDYRIGPVTDESFDLFFVAEK